MMLLGNTRNLIDVQQLRDLCQLIRTQTEEEIDGGSYACLTRLNEREVIFV